MGAEQHYLADFFAAAVNDDHDVETALELLVVEHLLMQRDAWLVSANPVETRQIRLLHITIVLLGSARSRATWTRVEAAHISIGRQLADLM